MRGIQGALRGIQGGIYGIQGALHGIQGGHIWYSVGYLGGLSRILSVGVPYLLLVWVLTCPVRVQGPSENMYKCIL